MITSIAIIAAGAGIALAGFWIGLQARNGGPANRADASIAIVVLGLVGVIFGVGYLSFLLLME